MIVGLVACSTSGAESNAAKVVENCLEAKKNNDYEAWKSTLWPAEKDDQSFTPSFEKPGDLGVISLSIKKVEVSDEETQQMKERYSGSDLAQIRGWSDEYISENMIVVSTQYTVDYDNTKVPYNEGTLTQDFILIRKDKDAPWFIWEATSPSMIVSTPTSVKTPDLQADWSYIDKPAVGYFNDERDIYGVEFELTYNSDSNQYEFKRLMGDCDKIISYTLTETEFTVVLNGEYDLLFPGNPDPIPTTVGINKTVNERGYDTIKDWYTINPPSIAEGEDGNYNITVHFDKAYQKGEITDVWFTFGKID